MFFRVLYSSLHLWIIKRDLIRVRFGRSHFNFNIIPENLIIFDVIYLRENPLLQELIKTFFSL